ncbi:MAG: histidine triad nucleotide-binding protein [Oscillospiraceae bacterium]|jgi:histidine triad (HIT) family protein|nr:histidine triad nucleotide-binding protein [Oscillospiraceae bacterium]
MADCVFCGIASGKIPSTIVYEDADVVAFRDVAPQTPVHILIVPREHVASFNEVDKLGDDIVAKMFRVASRLAKEQGLRERGYRLVSNCGVDACQSVPHLHIHLLGGRAMGADIA